jgi:hypothetical protein
MKLCGYSISPSKSVVGVRFQFEYLQISANYGRIHWRNQVADESEKAIEYSLPVSRIKDIYSKAQTRIERGSNVATQTCFATLVSAIIHSYKVFGDEQGYDSMVYPPVGTLFVPSNYGGGGIFPRSAGGGTSDSAIEVMCHMYPDINAWLSECTKFTGESVRSEVVSKAATKIMEGDITPKGMFDEGVAYINSQIPYNVIANSNAAQDRLANYGVTIPRVATPLEHARHLVSSAISGAIPNLIDRSKELETVDSYTNGHGGIDLGSALSECKYGRLEIMGEMELKDVVVSLPTAPLPISYMMPGGLADPTRRSISSVEQLRKLLAQAGIPRHVDVTTVIRIFRDLLRKNMPVDVLKDAMIAMGGNPSLVGRLVRKVNSSITMLNLTDAGRSSFGGGIFSCMNLDPRIYVDAGFIVDNTCLSEQDEVRHIILTNLLNFLLQTAIGTGKFLKIRYTLDVDDYNAMKANTSKVAIDSDILNIIQNNKPISNQD